MNCKPGDLAVVVHSECGNQGKIGRCIRLATTEEKRLNKYAWNPAPMWVMDRDFSSTYGPADSFMWDEFLRPIRPEEGEDETLSWAGLPQEVTA